MTHNFKLSQSSYKHSLSSYELSLSTYRLRLSLKFSPAKKRINTSFAKGFQRFFCNYFAGKQKKHTFAVANRKICAQMAESVDALVSNTSGATHPGSIPGLGTQNGC